MVSVSSKGTDTSAQDTMLSSLRPEEEEAQPVGGPEQEPTGVQGMSQHYLWVDEFAPKHYTELLSDDVSVLGCGWLC